MVNLDIKKKMALILSVGQILAENGAATDKIISDTKRVATLMKIPEENFNLKVMPTVLLLNVLDDEKSNIAFRNYESHGVDMNIVNLVSALTLKAANKNYSPRKFQDVLDRIIGQKKIYSPLQVILATGIFCGAFCFLFGGDIFASVYTAICASMGKFLQIRLLKWGINSFITTAAVAFAVTLGAYFMHFLPTQTMWTPLIACSLFLIPGIPIMNAITESLDGFLLNGMTKAYHSLLITVSITVGQIFAVIIGEKIEEITLSELMPLPNDNFGGILLAGILTSVAFSFLINMPKKILPLLGILGATALLTRNFMMVELNITQDIATFFAATLIGILAIKAQKFIQTTIQAITTPAIIAFVPGVLIYRFLSSCMYIKYMSAEEFFYEIGYGLDALQIIFAMTVGVSLPSLIAKRFLNKN